jgi:hypothetical protein
MKGHVYKRGKNWSYLFNMEPDPLTGKRRQANGSGYRTEREAWKACRAAMTEHEKGRIVSSSRRKVADALEEWLTRIEHSIKPSMVQNWRNYAAYYVVPYIGQRDVQDITGAVCDALYAKLLAEGRVKAKPKKHPARKVVHTRRIAPDGRVLPCRPYRRLLKKSGCLSVVAGSEFDFAGMIGWCRVSSGRMRGCGMWRPWWVT